jgi:hypothetical protein
MQLNPYSGILPPSAIVALERHWDASDASDFKVEHEIYREDAVFAYPQSGERIRGRHNIQQSRSVQPNSHVCDLTETSRFQSSAGSIPAQSEMVSNANSLGISVLLPVLAGI